VQPATPWASPEPALAGVRPPLSNWRDGTPRRRCCVNWRPAMPSGITVCRWCRPPPPNAPIWPLMSGPWENDRRGRLRKRLRRRGRPIGAESAERLEPSLTRHGRCVEKYQQIGRVAPRVGFEPTTSRLTAGCSTTELPRNRCSKEGGYTTPVWGVQGVLCTKENWRPGRESNSGARICNPLRNHSATRPCREQKMSRRGRIATRRAADGQWLAPPHCNGVKAQHISAPA